MSRLHNGETAKASSLLNLFICHQHSHRHMAFSITISTHAVQVFKWWVGGQLADMLECKPVAGVWLLDKMGWRTFFFSASESNICADLSAPVFPLCAQYALRMLFVLKVPCPVAWSCGQWHPCGHSEKWLHTQNLTWINTFGERNNNTNNNDTRVNV